jgi:hypothetical protein
MASLALAIPSLASAQISHRDHPGGSTNLLMLRASATGLLTRQDPGPLGNQYTEGYLTQPVIGVDARTARLFGSATLNLEGLTLRRGQLNTGAFGEGYVDRRHPHTYAHELMLGARVGAGAVRASVAGGKGFAPFGSDDPMVRDFASFPINHHLAHVPERLVAVGALRLPAVAVEVGAFNGDEPTDPESWPNADRFGDSWSARVTVFATERAELSASYARVASPEFRSGGGLDQRKSHIALGIMPCDTMTHAETGCRVTHVLLEWGRTSEFDGDVKALTYATGLVEVGGAFRWLRATTRLERTTRPEEERTIDPFRTPRPPSDLRSTGLTRWTAATLQLQRPVRFRRARMEPLIEASVLWPEQRVRGSTFAPRDFYQARRLTTVSVGVRAALGHEHSRMGRYGVALPTE